MGKSTERVWDIWVLTVIFFGGKIKTYVSGFNAVLNVITGALNIISSVAGDHDLIRSVDHVTTIVTLNDGVIGEIRRRINSGAKNRTLINTANKIERDT